MRYAILLLLLFVTSLAFAQGFTTGSGNVITVPGKGAAGTASPGGPAGGMLAGTYPNPSLNSTVGSDNIYNSAENGPPNFPDGANVSSASQAYQITGIDMLWFGAGGHSSNVAIGSGALTADTTGTGNFAMGQNALLSVTDGTNDVSIGNGSLANTVHGASDVGIGNSTLFNLTTANQVTAVGPAAGYGVTGGDYSTAIGSGALGLGAALDNITGTHNTAVGAQSLYVATGAAADNTAEGFQSCNALTTGTSNICLGEGGNITTGSSNILIGNSLADTTAGNSSQIDIGDTIEGLLGGVVTLKDGANSTFYEIGGNKVLVVPSGDTTGQSLAVGNGVLTSGSLSGSYNTGVGYQALMNDTTGVRNVGLGTSTLTTLTTGSQNMGIGQGAIFNLIDGSNNVGVGYNALDGSAHDNRNTAVGSISLVTLNGGSDNVAVGYGSQFFASTGQKNTSAGALSGQNISTGSNTVAVGYNTLGQGATQITGNNNTAVGFQALNVLQDVGADNTVIGKNAGSVMTTGGSNIIVGEGGNITTGSSNILIGNSLADTTAGNSSQIDIGDNIEGTLTGPIKGKNGWQFPKFAHNALPTCNAAEDGTMVIVQDAANAADCTIGATPAGTGTTYCTVVCHGSATAWVHS